MYRVIFHTSIFVLASTQILMANLKYNPEQVDQFSKTGVCID